MIEEKVPEVVAIGIHSGLLAQAGGPEELEGLQGAKGRLALGHRHRAAGHWYGPADARYYFQYGRT